MNRDHRIRIQYNLGLLLLCAGGWLAILGDRWAGLALVAAGAAVYFPASRRRKVTQGDPVVRHPARKFWGVAAAILIAAALSPAILPRLDRHENWRAVLPVALVVAPLLILLFYWWMIRRQSSAGRREEAPPPRPDSNEPGD